MVEMNEILARPSQPVTQTVAHVVINRDAVTINFPEKRDDYNAIVKYRFEYGWEWPCRVRRFDDATVNDRAAEIINALLAGGFCVKADKALVETAVSGSFEPEPRRWAKVFVSGDYEGWFAIGWMRGEEIYAAAKRLPGARYYRPRIAVPSEQYEAVIDFAGMYGCHIYPSAQRLIEQARAEFEAAIVVDVQLPRPTETSPVPVNGRPPVLDVPEHVGIDDDLADND